MDIKLSIIIPVFNMEKYLSECLDSVFEQTMNEIEVICIDDGSTDNTSTILENYQKMHTNMLVLYQNRQGAGSARNRGIEVANGEFVAFLDSDDYYPASDVLDYLYNGAKKNGTLMAGGSLYRVVNGVRRRHSDRRMVVDGENYCINAVDYQYAWGFYRFIYSKKMLVENNIKFPDFIRCQDPPFMLDSIISADKIWLTCKEVYAYRKFDKKIEFTSKNVVCDMAKANLYMMRKANEYMYMKLQENIIERIEMQSEIYIMHLMNENDELSRIFEEIKNNILDETLYKKFDELWCKKNIEKRSKELYQEALILSELIKRNELVLVYGAGEIGGQVYDYISSKKNGKFLGFAVTDNNPVGTLRGYEIKPLSFYKRYVENVLVVVAVKEDENNEMQNYAKDLGFKSIVCVSNKIGYVGLNEITDGKFAYDN